jgi:hypothetical protein
LAFEVLHVIGVRKHPSSNQQRDIDRMRSLERKVVALLWTDAAERERIILFLEARKELFQRDPVLDRREQPD